MIDRVKALFPILLLVALFLSSFGASIACGATSRQLRDYSNLLTIDLNQDGVIYRMPETRFFDLDANDLVEQTEWVTPPDGFLVMDRDGDGLITSGREFFGNHTILSDGSLAEGGLQALKDLDENRDLKIDAQDGVFSRLQAWVDKNGNGECEEGELSGIEALGVKSIRWTGTLNAPRRVIDNAFSSLRKAILNALLILGLPLIIRFLMVRYPIAGRPSRILIAILSIFVSWQIGLIARAILSGVLQEPGGGTVLVFSLFMPFQVLLAGYRELGPLAYVSFLNDAALAFFYFFSTYVILGFGLAREHEKEVGA